MNKTHGMLGRPEDVLRVYYRTNKNLPEPKSKVQGPIRALPLSNALGVRMQVVPNDTKKSHEYWISIDNKTFYFGMDVSYIYKDLQIEDYQDNDLYIGDAVIPNTHSIHKTFPSIHIQSPWNDSLWNQTIPKNKMPSLLTREGWCCTMGNSKPHRDVVANNIYKLLDNSPYYFVYDGIHQDLNYLKQYMFRNVPRKKDLSVNWEDAQLQDWHYKCLLEIVPETNDDIFYPSEKTWKPIAAEQIFVVIACKHYLRRIKQMGFKTFHPYIDESYDNENNMTTRVDKAIDSIKQFLSSKSKCMDDLQDIVKHNKKRLLQLQKMTYYSHVAKKIKKFIR